MRRQIRFLGHSVKNFNLVLFLSGIKRIYYSSRAKLSQRGPKRQSTPAREASRDTTCMPNYISICSLWGFNLFIWDDQGCGHYAVLSMYYMITDSHSKRKKKRVKYVTNFFIFVLVKMITMIPFANEGSTFVVTQKDHFSWW